MKYFLKNLYLVRVGKIKDVKYDVLNFYVEYEDKSEWYYAKMLKSESLYREPKFKLMTQKGKVLSKLTKENVGAWGQEHIFGIEADPVVIEVKDADLGEPSLRLSKKQMREIEEKLALESNN